MAEPSSDLQHQSSPIDPYESSAREWKAEVKFANLDQQKSHGLALASLPQNGDLGMAALESIEEVNVLFEKVKAYSRADADLGTEYQGYL